VLIERVNHEEIERREHALRERRLAIGNKAAEKYLPQFNTYIKSLKFKTAMHEAIGGYSSIQKFRERTRYGQGLDQIIEQGLRENPARALARMNIKDAEISTELAAISEEKASLDKFVKQIHKHPIPNIDHD
jgi:hypothetical protein